MDLRRDTGDAWVPYTFWFVPAVEYTSLVAVLCGESCLPSAMLVSRSLSEQEMIGTRSELWVIVIGWEMSSPGCVGERGQGRLRWAGCW